MSDIVPVPADYAVGLNELKTRIHEAQQRATRALNRELVLLYWQIGGDILARQGREGWGAKIIERLAQDLRNAFPDVGFVQAVLAQLPWYRTRFMKHTCLRSVLIIQNDTLQ